MNLIMLRSYEIPQSAARRIGDGYEHKKPLKERKKGAK
jgi:hypothetical protein